MIPKTDIQRKVVRLRDKLPKLNKKQLQWSKSLFDKFKYERKYDCSCFECGHRFPKSDRKTCPKCHSRLQTWKETIRSGKDWWMFSVFTTINEFQVLRYFRINKYMKVDKKAEYVVREVYQHWISTTGKHVLLARLINPFSYYSFDPWSHSDMEVRHTSNNHLVSDIPMYPYRRLLPELYRNGFTDEYYNFHPAQLFTLILGSSIAETFLKSGNIKMLEVFSRDQKVFTRHYPSYKICMRHHYKIDDIGMWLDHMELLRYFKYDLRSPKYICSDTFKEDHQRLILKKQTIERQKNEERRKLDKKRYEAEQREIRRKEQLALKAKKKYKDLVFKDNDIRIVVLSKIEDFKKEGEMLQHCVYTNQYYKRPLSLIFSARKKGRRLETIEVDLKDVKILQARGYKNEPTKYHDEILRIMNKNINKIKQIA